MKAVIIKIDKNKAIILKSDGDFICIPRKNYKLGQEIYVEDSKKQGFVKFAKVAVAAAVFLLMIGSGVIYAYNTPQCYLSLDINSNFEFEVNMFNRVINATSANEDGTAVLEKMEITHKSLDEVINLIINQVRLENPLSLSEDKTVVVGIHCLNLDIEQKVMESAELQIKNTLENFKISAAVSVNFAENTTENASNIETILNNNISIYEYLGAPDSDTVTIQALDITVKNPAENTNKEQQDILSNSENSNTKNGTEIKDNKNKGTVPKTNNGNSDNNSKEEKEEKEKEKTNNKDKKIDK